MRLGFDISNYSATPTPQQAAQLRALGFEFAIVGTSYGTGWPAQIAALGAAGFAVAEYQFPAALRATSRPWWVDAELSDATLDSLRNALSVGAQGPYSRKGWANDTLPDWDCLAEFPSARLWDARYVHGDGACGIQDAIDNGTDVAIAIAEELATLRPFAPYWGFESAAITQWHNSITICGINMDLNVEEGMDADTKAAIAAVLAQQAALGAKVDALQASTDFLIQVVNGLVPRVTALEAKP